jgi:hypothetical protein
MTVKAHGPLLEDYKRAIKAAKWAGWKAVRVEVGNGATIVLLADDTYLERLERLHSPSQDLKPEEEKPKPKLVW